MDAEGSADSGASGPNRKLEGFLVKFRVLPKRSNPETVLNCQETNVQRLVLQAATRGPDSSQGHAGWRTVGVRL